MPRGDEICYASNKKARRFRRAKVYVLYVSSLPNAARNSRAYIDKLTHSMKSLATICAMLEAEEGYSGNWDPYYYGNDRGYSGRERRAGYSREGSGNDGGYSREGREGRYSREGRARRYSGEGREMREGRYSGNGYSRNGEVTEHLRMLMDEAPDESTRMEIKRLMDKFDQR